MGAYAIILGKKNSCPAFPPQWPTNFVCHLTVCGCVEWWLKFFGCHKKGRPNFLVTHPCGNWNGTRCGDWKFLVPILSSLFFGWQPNFFNCHKRGATKSFCKALVKRFSITCGMPLFLAIEKFQSPFKKLWWFDGNQNFESCPSLCVTKTSKKGFVIFPVFACPSDNGNQIWWQRPNPFYCHPTVVIKYGGDWIHFSHHLMGLSKFD